MPGSVAKPDGTLGFGSGVDSLSVTTVQSQASPNGLRRDQLAWLVNGTVRDGGITQRWGWQPKGRITDGQAIFQGGFMYRPLAGFPYLILSIGGHILQIDPDTGTVTDLSVVFALLNPPDIDYAYFVQAEQFLVIQAGDGTTLPLFWDGTTLRRSIGITNPAVAPGTPGVNEIPAAYAMEYFMGRLWYAQQRNYSAGDIVGGTSGTLPYGYRDSVLNVTENPLVVGGDGFSVPAESGNIRAIKTGAAIDAALGQGRLFIFTAKAIFALQVPVSRTDWIAANNNNQPLQTVVQLTNGAVNDRSVVAVNGDLYFQSLEPGIRSLLQAVRYFNQPGNIQISANENRVLQLNDRGLLRFSSGIFFDNRMLQTTLPFQSVNAVVSRALIPYDFVPISTQFQQRPPNWEGISQGLLFMQLFSGDFGGRERAFAMVQSEIDGSFNLWEFTIGEKFENGDQRVGWQIEFPAFTWGKELELKKLVTAELWIDRIVGTVAFTLEWRPDGETCWRKWHEWTLCSTRNTEETVSDPIAYPVPPCGPTYRQTMKVPKPPNYCSVPTGRPSHIGYQMQPRLTVKGFCRVRGILLYAETVEDQLYQGMICT